MGAIADGIMAYAQPLLDQTDGSMEQLNKALAITQFCYNVALLPADSRKEAISEMRQSLGMDEEEFEDFVQSIVDPMIRRHEAMFPQLHGQGFARPVQRVPSPHVSSLSPSMAQPAKRRATTDRYAPCPCGSGKKYKFCCGLKGR